MKSRFKTSIQEELSKEKKNVTNVTPNSNKKSGLSTLISNSKSISTRISEYYLGFWSNFDQENYLKKRLNSYSLLSQSYYNSVTDFYEYGWGESFHFCTFYKGENFCQSITRHEHYLSYKMGLKEDMKVLDVGCGIGGPAREITRFIGCDIIGFNNNDYQIQKAKCYTTKYQLDDKITYHKGDFMNIDFPDNTFDAVYSIEATVHAPDLKNVYGEIFRVLKPGGVFGLYEWVLTDKFDETNPEHAKIIYGIELGDGIPKLITLKFAEQSLIDAGFEIEYKDDLAQRNKEIPWYSPLAGNFKYCFSYKDCLTLFRSSRIGRFFTYLLIQFLEFFNIVPSGSKKIVLALEEAAQNLVKGGESELFTPMMMYIAKKP